ncbi:MAG: DUF433 domain-containing protein [Chloroflexi bacterium]|nr:DUF433 domain-containing protein [Chloroflexota bacterium]
MTKEQPRYHDRIIQDPEILVGKPVIKGTRIPVELVLKRLAQDLDLETIYASYPRLTPEDIKACLEYAHVLVERKKRARHVRTPEAERASL